MTPEFSRPHRLDQIGAGESKLTVTADAEERAALARRFGLIAIGLLEASYALRRDANGVRASGHLIADVTQSCIVTEDPVPAHVAEDFDIRFVAEPVDGAEDLELSAEECDIVFFSGGAIDLGEAAAETLALALDPFPRSAAAETALREAGVLREEEVQSLNPLAQALKDKLGK